MSEDRGGSGVCRTCGSVYYCICSVRYECIGCDLGWSKKAKPEFVVGNFGLGPDGRYQTEIVDNKDMTKILEEFKQRVKEHIINVATSKAEKPKDIPAPSFVWKPLLADSVDPFRVKFASGEEFFPRQIPRETTPERRWKDPSYRSAYCGLTETKPDPLSTVSVDSTSGLLTPKTKEEWGTLIDSIREMDKIDTRWDDPDYRATYCGFSKAKP